MQREPAPSPLSSHTRTWRGREEGGAPGLSVSFSPFSHWSPDPTGPLPPRRAPPRPPISEGRRAEGRVPADTRKERPEPRSSQGRGGGGGSGGGGGAGGSDGAVRRAVRGGAGPSRAEHWGWGAMPDAECVNAPRRFQKVRGWLQWNGPR